MELKLWEIADAYLRISDFIGEDEGWQQALTDIAEEFDSKVENVAKMVKTFEAESKVYQEEAKRLGDKAGAAANRASSLKEYLLREMLTIGRDKIQGAIFKVSLMVSPPSCEVVNEEEVLKLWKRLIPERWEVDKKAILEAWRADGSVPSGVTIVDDKKHLLIK